jgi:hypothetical protein
MEKTNSHQSRLGRFYQKHESGIIGFSSVASFLIAWEAVVMFGWVNALFLAPPTDIVVSLWELSKGRLWEDVYVSTLEFVLGFVFSVLLGIPFGLLVGWNRRAYYASSPFVDHLGWNRNLVEGFDGFSGCCLSHRHEHHRRRTKRGPVAGPCRQGFWSI